MNDSAVSAIQSTQFSLLLYLYPPITRKWRHDIRIRLLAVRDCP